MSEKPILFNTEMVRAILDGRKTQTRRIAKTATYIMSSVEKLDEELSKGIVNEYAPFQPGDILWVRETWCKWWLPHGAWQYCYKATQPYGNIGAVMPDSDDEPIIMPWKPSIHMPKEAARLFLWVTGVRIERLRDITMDEIKAEGVDVLGKTVNTSFRMWRELWDSTVKKADLPRYGWEANPWVWVIEFERYTP